MRIEKHLLAVVRSLTIVLFPDNVARLVGVMTLHVIHWRTVGNSLVLPVTPTTHHRWMALKLHPLGN